MPRPSARHVAVVKRYLEAFNRRDLEAAVEMFHPAVEIFPAPMPYYTAPGTTYHGRIGAQSLLQAVLARAPDLRLEPQAFRAVDDRLLVSILLIEKPGAPNVDACEATILYRLEGGQIVRMDAFTTEEEAYGAAATGEGATAPADRLLTPREREVFQLLALGLNAWAIADQLSISPDTVRTHVRNGVVKLGAKTRVQAVALALKLGEIEL